MKNILLIIPNMDFGGAQRSFSKLSLMLAEKHRVVNVVFNAADGVVYPLGGRILSLDIEASGSVWSKLSNFYKRISKLKKIKKEHNIDVAISFLEGADFINVLSKRNEKIIISIRGSKLSDETIQGFTGWLRRKMLIPFLYKKADWITSVNKGIVYELNSFFHLSSVKKKVISNYYDVAELQAMAQEELPVRFSGLATKPYLVFSGRLAPEKGIDKLLQVYARIREKSQCRFVVVGAGPMKEKLINLCQTLELTCSEEYQQSADVIFVGEQKNPHRFVAQSILFLMGSSSEGFPNGLAEAMACGIPVVSTDCPWGPREILSESNQSELPEYANYGILLPMLNSKGQLLEDALSIWAGTLDTLILDQQLRAAYGKKGLERIKGFNEQQHAQAWSEIID